LKNKLLLIYNSFITKVRGAIGIFSKKKKWEGFFASLDKFSDDFMVERNQPKMDKR